MNPELQLHSFKGLVWKALMEIRNGGRVERNTRVMLHVFSQGLKDIEDT